MKQISISLVQRSRCTLYHMVIPCIAPSHFISGLINYSTYKYRRSIKDCYRLLNIHEGCSIDEVRDSYKDLAKKYHPDSGSSTADANTFIQIDEAYRDLLNHLSREAKESEGQEDLEKTTSNYKTPQHRQYLTFEGVGYGTPSQRQKQYTQFRVDRAAQQVLDFRTQKLESQNEENTMIAKDIRQSKKTKITQAIERLVEDLIQESMAKGDFDNLSGKGKPLQKFSHCPHIDPMTHNLNRILIDNGYQPEWILLQKEIRETIEKLRNEVLASRKKLGDPLTPRKKEQWQEKCEDLREDITQLNKRINDFNLVVPLLNIQMVHFNVDKEIARAERAYTTFKEAVQKDSEGIKKEECLADNQLYSKASLLTWIKTLKMF
ncbi:dnaJ homolog subfamily C member 28 [Bombina bombina]|uniref:dnaJ homolog subfamily C member 28 n=1 Tax=Bombina bombina TaxID=8345 RepID=UPI00235AACA9|nr:dnaJ homolog subfamily C member 28 [Bombina bombina]XP_053561936.1 dnaJ homolog subfamily C member 28 [Bombina bombina]